MMIKNALNNPDLFSETHAIGAFAVDESGCVTGWDKKITALVGIDFSQAKGSSLVDNNSVNKHIFGFRSRSIFAINMAAIKKRTTQDPTNKISMEFAWPLLHGNGKGLLLNVIFLGVINQDNRLPQYVFIASEYVPYRLKHEEFDNTFEVLEKSYQLSKLYRATGDTEEYFTKMLEELLQLSNSEYGFIGEVRVDVNSSPYLVTRALTNIAWDKETLEFYANRPMVFRNLNTLFGSCLATAEIVISNQTAEDPRRGGLPPGHPQLNKFIGIPIKRNGRMVGMLGMANNPTGYDQSITSRLEPILGVCSDVFNDIYIRSNLEHIKQNNLALFNKTSLMNIVTRRDTDSLLGIVIQANESFIHELMFDSLKVLGIQTLSFFHSESHEKIHNIVKKLASTINQTNQTVTTDKDVKYSALVKMVNGKHHIVPAEVTLSLAINSHSEVTGLNLSCKDVIEELSAKFNKAQIETEWLSLINNAKAGVISIDNNFNITEWSQGMVAITGFEESSMIGKDYFDFINIDSSDNYRGHLKNLLDGKENNFSFEVDLITNNHRNVRILISSVCKHDKFGEIIGIGAIGQDITILSEQAAAIMHSQKVDALGLMAGGLAHDLNNILTIIIGNLELIWLEIDENAAVKDMIDDALTSASDGYDITRRLMVFSRAQVVNKRDIPVNSLVTGFLKILTRSLGGKINLIFNEDVSNPIIKADANQLETALLNLVLNSRDALKGVANPKIIISIEHTHIDRVGSSELESLSPGDYTIINVSDNGIGMSPAVRVQALDPYFTTKPVGTGTGFGLSTVHGFSKNCGGGMSVRSLQYKGTSIKLYLPTSSLQPRTGSDDISVIEENLNIGKANTGVGVGVGVRNILVVDDNDEVLKVVAKSLQKWGFNTYTAENADEALRLLSRQSGIEMLLSDIVMHGSLSGRDLASTVKKIYPNIIIMLMTGYEPSSKNMDNFDTFVLYKPFHKDQFFRGLEECLHNKNNL